MKVGIIGLGGLGQIAARVAVLIGAETHVAETKQDAWGLGQRLGVQHLVEDAAEWSGQNFDLIVDYAGFGATTTAAIRAVRTGGTVVQVGLGVREANVPLGEVVSKEVSLLGSRGGTKQDIAELYELVASGELTPEVTEIGFDDIPDGLQALADNRVTGRLVALI
jgi:propanol-preferring alcohol dehydrogenase